MIKVMIIEIFEITIKDFILRNPEISGSKTPISRDGSDEKLVGIVNNPLSGRPVYVRRDQYL